VVCEWAPSDVRTIPTQQVKVQAMKLIGSSLVLALSMLSSAAYSNDTSQKQCDLFIEFGDEMIAHRMPCEDGTRFSVQFSGLTVSYHVRNNGAWIEISPRNFAFFDGGRERFIEVRPSFAAVEFYDRDAKEFVQNSLNQAAGTIKLSRGDK
jgi:hypothetical protein